MKILPTIKKDMYTLSGDSGTDDEFGWSVSLNDDGSVLAVGSLQIDIDSPSDKDVPKAGLVKVFNGMESCRNTLREDLH